MKDLILNSAYFSISVQLIIGILGLHGIFIKLQEKDSILTHIMIMETLVQFIELTFYIWIIMQLSRVAYEVTFVRYFDWFITTPIMLISTTFFMEYLNKKDQKIITVESMINTRSTELIQIFVSNLLMLLFGFLAELKVISRVLGFVLGTIAFCYSFYIIYSGFVGTNIISQYLFYFIFIVWFLYGVAFLFPYVKKNIMYNFLDILSKNFYGLFIYYTILKTSAII